MGSSMDGLSHEEMKEVSVAFQEAMSFVISNTSADSQEKIQRFIAEVVVTQKPYTMLTKEGIVHSVGLVFKDAQITDYVLTLWHCFASRWAYSDEAIAALAGNFSRGASQTNEKTYAFSSIPQELKSRMVKRADAFEILSSNPWLLVLLLISLVVRIPSDKTK